MARVIEMFRPIVKRAFAEHVSDQITKRLESVRIAAEVPAQCRVTGRVGVGQEVFVFDIAEAGGDRVFGVEVLPLYARLPTAEQQRVFAPHTNRRVVLATNVAETSLTIDGIRVVVDSGLERRVRFDLGSGLERLELKPIARASATQRAGRAGRLGPGVCYRLWSSEQQERLDEQSPPEIANAELTPLLSGLEAGLPITAAVVHRSYKDKDTGETKIQAQVSDNGFVING